MDDFLDFDVYPHINGVYQEGISLMQQEGKVLTRVILSGVFVFKMSVLPFQTERCQDLRICQLTHAWRLKPFTQLVI